MLLNGVVSYLQYYVRLFDAWPQVSHLLELHLAFCIHHHNMLAEILTHSYFEGNFVLNNVSI